jgi:quercetin dioxygenase-like cupin family protein
MINPMSAIKKFTGDWDQNFSWDGTRSRMYQNTDTNQVSETWMIGKKEGAENFAFRYYQLSPGSHSREEQHPYDHGILVLQGEGEVLLGEKRYPVSRGDIIYIEPDIKHQLNNTSKDALGFLCVIQAKRKKSGVIVWAEEGIKFNE